MNSANTDSIVTKGSNNRNCKQYYTSLIRQDLRFLLPVKSKLNAEVRFHVSDCSYQMIQQNSRVLWNGVQNPTTMNTLQTNLLLTMTHENNFLYEKLLTLQCTFTVSTTAEQNKYVTVDPRKWCWIPSSCWLQVNPWHATSQHQSVRLFQHVLA